MGDSTGVYLADFVQVFLILSGLLSLLFILAALTRPTALLPVVKIVERIVLAFINRKKPPASPG